MNQDNKTITIVGRFNFPKGDAASARVLGVGKILKYLGYDVVFIGKCTKPKNESCLSGDFEGFSYHNIVNKSSLLNRLRQVFFSGKMTIAMIENKNINPDIIIYYGSSSTFLAPLLRYKKKNNIKLITDIVEWYDPTHLAGGKYGPLAIDVNYSMKKLIPKCDGVIVISSYLQKYYQNFGVETVRVPILIDSKNDKWAFEQLESFNSESLNLVYAGNPGRKDLVDIVIDAVNELVDEGKNVVFHMFGPNVNQIRNLLGQKGFLVDKLKNHLKIYGRVNQDEIPQNIAKADFSVLIRPNKRYANAGFPTKFVESLAAGVPVIANLTSDLNLYLNDDENGLIVDGYDINSIKTTLLKAIELDSSKVTKMKASAKNSAITSFDYMRYINPVEKFLNSLN